MSCTRCWLHKSVKVVSMNARPNKKAPLQIFIDGPTAQDDQFGGYGSSRVARLLFWMLEKWTLYPEEVGINFTLRCCTKTVKKKRDKFDAIEACMYHTLDVLDKAKAVLGMGELSSIRLLGNRPIGNTVYQRHNRAMSIPVFISYSPGYILGSPAEVVDGLRMLHDAAEAAGLQTELNTELELFDFGQI